MAEYAKPRGTADILPDEAAEWRYVEEQAREVFELYHFREIRTPIFEHTEVFERGVGDTTDIVQKEMYTFKDRGDRAITLRPEGTAGVVRAFVEQKLYGGPLPVKWFYYGPMFRYEKPQAGRFRQFHQYGVEVIGADDPRVDAEVIELAYRFLRRVGVQSLRLEVNSVGCAVCRARHKEALLAHLKPALPELCADCQSRYEKNPLRIQDCKIDHDHPLVRTSPTITEYLCADCSAHFEEVKSYLDELAVPYIVNPTMVRGLDYYTRTAFEFMEDSIGAMSTVLAGGRYNRLVADFGGPDLPGIGFAGGIERLLLARAANQAQFVQVDRVDVYVIAMGAAALRPSVRLIQALREQGVRVDLDYLSHGMKSQMKTADRLHAKLALIIGEDEVAQGVVGVRDLAAKTQEAVAVHDVVQLVLQILSESTQGVNR
ncbi:MAG: histidine--tRNA ligase [Firmicutes bacterium]|nr:histidine--tRNA ligase [Bacillota bacterium]